MVLRCLVLIFSAILPVWAQTSGATAPEVTQFEPVDISDLVNLANGDFTYAVPVMTLPGAPGGSYPLSLSYQAGVLHGQEASWVGLGWNLQPGSVSRFVRSIPDDYHGALTTTKEHFEGVYSYNVGFGYQGWTIGVNWDNHGGFGGSLGRSGDKAFGGNATLGFHNRNGFSADVGLNHQSSGVGVGISLSQHGDVSSSFRYSGENGTFVGLSSSGTVGFGNSDVSMHLSSGRTETTALATQTSVNSDYVSLSIKAFNFGWGRTKVIRAGANEAWGALHLDKVGESTPHQQRAKMRIAEDVKALPSNDPGFHAVYQSRVDGHGFFPSYQRRDERFPDAPYKHVGLALDTYFQDFQKGTTPVPDDDDQQDAMRTNQAYEADYVTTSFDGYSIAAQGLTGMAKPVHAQRGFLAPSDSSASVSLGDGWHFYPYRNLYRLMEEGSIPWDADLNAFFRESRWRTRDALQDNMVMLTDPALLTDHTLFPMSVDQPIGDGAAHKRHAVHNRSRRIRYALDGEARIARIIVTNPDGVVYHFGVLQDADGLVTAGARPMNLRESTFQRTSSQANHFDSSARREEHKTEPYAYAWYLAAVTSPHFVDRAPLGHFGPEDFGDYVTFHYALTNPSYHWRTPYSESDTEGEEPSYALTGRNSYDDTFHFQRNTGFKDFYHPLLAKTRTHLAVFEHDRDRADNVSARVNPADSGAGFVDPTRPVPNPLGAFTGRDVLVYTAGPHFFSAASFIDQNAPSTTQQRFLGSFNLQADATLERVLLFPAGTAAKWGVSVDQSLVAGYLWARNAPMFGQGDLTYLGNWDYGHHDVFRITFHVATPPLPPPPQTPGSHGLFSHLVIRNPALSTTSADGSAEASMETFNGSIKLKAIRLYARGPAVDDAIFQTGSATAARDLSAWLDDTAWRDGFMNEVRFTYDQDLAPGYPNVRTPGTGKLALTEVNFFGRSGAVPLGNGYRFDYHRNPDAFADRAYYRKDPWGYPSSLSEPYAARVDDRNVATVSGQNVPVQALDSLASIETPVGSRLAIVYERDTYTWIQDRPALTRDQQMTFFEAGEPGKLVDYVRGETLPIRFRTSSGRPLPLETILAQLADFTWRWADNDPNVYQGHVMVLARGSSRNNCPFLNTRGECETSGTGGVRYNSNDLRFVLPVKRLEAENRWSLAIDKVSNTLGIAEHPSVREFASWIWHEIDHPRGDLVRFQVQQIPGRNQTAAGEALARVVPVATDYQDPYRLDPRQRWAVGELTGSLRVKRIQIGPSQTGSEDPDMVRSVVYDYRDPDWDADSGVIFAEPTGNIQGVGGDRRLLRGEAYPYLFMPGADVHYGTVTIQQENARFDTGKRRVRMKTAADPAVVHGTFVETVKPYQDRVALSWDGHQAHRQLLQFKNLTDGDQPWEAAPFNNVEDLVFSFDYQVRTRVVNQAGLIGRQVEALVLDTLGRPIQRTTTEYRAAYDPSLPALPVKRFYRDDAGRLAEETLAGNGAAGALNNLMPGVHAEKHFGLLIGRKDSQGKHFRVKALLQDEIWNTYRPMKSTLSYFEQLGTAGRPTSLESEVIAIDFSNGSNAITETRALSADGRTRYQYVWQIPAHEFWMSEDSAGLKNKNMLVQKGMTLSVVSHAPLRPTAERPWLSQLAQAEVAQLYANIDLWRPGLNRDQPENWLFAGSASFAPDLNGRADQVLSGLTFAPGADGYWHDSYAESSAGRWEVAYQNTAYNRFNRRVERRDRMGNFSALVFEASGRRVVASFANAKRDQVFFEDFEDYREVAGGAYPAAKANPLGYQITTLTAPDAHNLSAAAYMARYQQVYSGRGAALGPVTLNVTPAVNPADPNGPYYLSFYCRPDSGSTLNLNIPGGWEPRTVTLTAQRPASASRHITIRPMVQGWFYVKIKLNRDQLSGLTLGQAGMRLDDIAAYPAGSSPGTGAMLNHFAYDPHFQKLSASTDGRGRTVRYQYNADGELWRVFDGDGAVRQEFQVLEHRRRPATNPAP
ncbi:hypothetical protein [Acanthopleuribacter pedis]|uniref:Uncharacterized protein n=1 Tax=Acanthopleuribacter pedis TaxID=442870 RepID=A0A8J7U6S1_9BACT|nr:hypothetical protein [Acanthopleuribacter pedis]MBO1320676.1 hypothetical protein [Acanthopleuribacter pedis]